MPIALPALILYACIVSYQTLLDIQGKKIDNQLKQMELQEKLAKAGINTNKKPSKAASEFIQKLQQDNNIQYFKMNNRVLKEEQE